MLHALNVILFLAAVATGVVTLLAKDETRGYADTVKAARLPLLAVTLIVGGWALALWLAKTQPSLAAVREWSAGSTVGLLVPFTMCMLISLTPQPHPRRQAQARGHWEAARFLRWPLLAGIGCSAVAYALLTPFA